MSVEEKLSKALESNIKSNCGSCCHEKVCVQKGNYRSGVEKLIKELEPYWNLVECRMKCADHMFVGGTTFEL